MGQPAWYGNESYWFWLPRVPSGTPLVWIEIRVTSTSILGTVATCKGSRHMLAKTISPLSSFQTGWWIPSGSSDLSTPGLLIRFRASYLALFDLVPRTCGVQCSVWGVWIPLANNEFIQSLHQLLLGSVTVIKWVLGCSKWLPPFWASESASCYWLHNLLATYSRLVLILCPMGYAHFIPSLDKLFKNFNQRDFAFHWIG